MLQLPYFEIPIMGQAIVPVIHWGSNPRPSYQYLQGYPMYFINFNNLQISLSASKSIP